MPRTVAERTRASMAENAPDDRPPPYQFPAPPSLLVPGYSEDERLLDDRAHRPPVDSRWPILGTGQHSSGGSLKVRAVAEQDFQRRQIHVPRSIEHELHEHPPLPTLSQRRGGV